VHRPPKELLPPLPPSTVGVPVVPASPTTIVSLACVDRPLRVAAAGPGANTPGPAHSGPGQTQVRSGQVRSGQVRSGQVRSGQVRSVGIIVERGASRPARRGSAR
jgi:hypothetical protein